jgi:hypothetical protein
VNNITSGFSRFQKITGNLFFLAIAVYAIVYAIERVTYIDSAWIFYQGVNFENFSFGWERFGAFFSEIPLFIAVKLHLPFKALVYIFSLSFPLLYYMVWRICTYTLRNPAAGLVILLGMIMGVRETFIHTVTETHQVIVFSALLFALLEFEFKNNFKKNILVSAALILVVFTHPFGVFTAGFTLLYHFAKSKKIKEAILPFAVLLLAGLGMAFFLSSGNEHNTVFFQKLKDFSFSSSPGGNRPLGFIEMHFMRFYWLPELAGLIAVLMLAFQKKWLLLIILFLSVFFYLLIALIIFREGDSSIMLERIFLPAFFMINISLADELANTKQLNRWIPMALVFFFLVNGIHYINNGCLMYKKRLDYIDQLTRDAIADGHELYFLSDARTDKEKILVPWAFGTETLVYSRFRYNKSISITLEDETCAAGTFRCIAEFCQPVSEFNTRYFNMKGEAYVELK